MLKDPGLELFHLLPGEGRLEIVLSMARMESLGVWYTGRKEWHSGEGAAYADVRGRRERASTWGWNLSDSQVEGGLQGCGKVLNHGGLWTC